MKLGVVIPTAGREDLLYAVLRSLEHRRCERWELAVVADGCDPARDSLEVLERVNGSFVLNEAPRGIAYSWNRGARYVFDRGCDVALVLNDDVELPQCAWDDALVSFLERRPEVQCVCWLDRLTASTLLPGMTPSGAELDRPQAERWGWRPWQPVTGQRYLAHADSPYPGGFEAFSRTFWDLHEHTFHPASMNGAAFAIRREAFEALGGFDERFQWPGCFEDVDFWLRLVDRYGQQALGTHCGLFLHHLRSSTLSSLPRLDAQAGIDANRVRFKQKWATRQTFVDAFAQVNATAVGDPQLDLEQFRQP